ncbi:fasciclin-2 isoform X3 [Linepithema humile]|uniref:fasciclin-2 isoform X3 n=1 Tax=Linepithema humile TaxID=83485 RepID=UPI00062381A3|nr:PREDICTED: fasciclin-2 isoform X1 [Linepithema humile]
MAAYRERPTCVAIAVLLLQLAVYAKAVDPHLEILPSTMLTRPIHTSVLITCKPKVDNPDLVSNMQWFDPQERLIDPLNRNNAYSKPSMYTELHTDGSLSLIFNSIEEKQAGKYTCKGTYTRNENMMAIVTIDTIIAITWDNAPENQYPILGEDYAVQCQVRARPSPSIDWLYNGELIRTNDHYVIEPYSLKIKNVQESDDGVYTCRASVQTTGELKERPIRVEVHIRPTIDEILSPVDIVEGENANIECKAKGKPPPTISWIKSISQQNLSNADRFGVNPVTGQLTITNVHRDDAGEYQCIAENRANITKANIQVNVIVKPKIMEFENRTSVEGKRAQIACKAFGRPPPSVTFRKFTANKPFTMGVQPKDDRIIMENKTNELSGETIGILTIDNVLTDNDGLYECVASNVGGVTYKNGHLTVEFPPSFRSMPNVTVYSWNQRPVNLTCIAESIPNATIEWQFGHNPIDRLEEYTGGYIKQIGNGPYSVLRVEPYNQRLYNYYRCVATNTHGKREILIELREAKVPDNLRQVKMIEMTATTIQFELIPPETRDLPIETITVQYKENTRETWIQARNKTWVIGSVYVIEDLKPQTNYEFRFAVRNQVGMSNWGSNYVETMPGRTVPNIPRFVRKKSLTDYELSPFNNQYELSWVTPPDNGEPIDKYLIKYCEVTPGTFQVLENTCERTEINSQGRTRQYLKMLRSETFYRVELQAHNVMGYSKSGVLSFKTARGVNSVLHHEGPLISSGAIVGIVVSTVLIISIIIDTICCCLRRGILYYMCERFRRKPVDEEDTKLGSLYGWRFPLPYCDQKMANVAGVTAIQDSGSGKNTIRLVKHTAIDEKEPLKEEKKITPIIDSGLRRETSVTFDGKRSVSKTGFVGKDSAV